MEKIIDVRCPCCNMPLKIEMKLSDSGEFTVGLFHYIQEAEYSAITDLGYEFGIMEGGEEDGQR
jgi:hypothetical protein